MMTSDVANAKPVSTGRKKPERIRRRGERLDHFRYFGGPGSALTVDSLQPPPIIAIDPTTRPGVNVSWRKKIAAAMAMSGLVPCTIGEAVDGPRRSNCRRSGPPRYARSDEAPKHEQAQSFRVDRSRRIECHGDQENDPRDRHADEDAGEDACPCQPPLQRYLARGEGECGYYGKDFRTQTSSLPERD